MFDVDFDADGGVGLLHVVLIHKTIYTKDMFTKVKYILNCIVLFMNMECTSIKVKYHKI